MGRGRQVADAYIEVHGDLSQFRDDLNGANATMEDWAKSQADTFTESWGKRMRSQMDDQWSSVLTAMYSKKRLDFDRMIDAFDPDDHVAAFMKIADMMDALVAKGRLNEDQMEDMTSAISKQIDINEKLMAVEMEQAAARDMRSRAYRDMLKEEASAKEAETQMFREAFAMNQAHDAVQRKMDAQAAAQHKRNAEARQKQIEALIASNDRWRRSFAGVMAAASEIDLEQKFRNIGFAMETNDWSRIAQGAKNMQELGNRTTQTTREMVNLGRMTEEEFASVQARLRNVSADLGGFNVKFAESNKASAQHSRDWSVINRMVGSAGKKFAGFSGLNVLTDIFKQGAEFFQDLDRNAVQIGKMALQVGTLGSAVVSMLGGVAVVGQDLAKMGQIGILAPAFLTGAAIGAGVLIAALKDMGTVLADLKPRFEELQNSISTNFWAVAEGPIRNLVDTLLPTLSIKLAETSTALGGMFAALSDSLASISTNDISTMFDRFNAGLVNATGAMDPLVQAFNTMGMVGSEYFERFGTWITEISTQFNNFIQTAAADGRLNLWIEEAILAFQNVWSILGSAVGIFNSIGTAAEAAGIGGLSVLAANLEKVTEVMNSPEFQGTLTRLFTGAADATRSVGTAILELGPAIQSFMPVLSTALSTVGETVATVIGYIGQIMSNPTFQQGLEDFINGVQKGVEALAPAIGPMAGSLGQIGTLLGQVAGQVGELVAAFVVNLSPILDQVTAAFGRITFAAGPEILSIIETLGGVLGNFVNTLLPPLESLVMSILPLIAPAFEALVPVAEAVQNALAPIIERVQQLVDMIAPVLIPAIQQIADALAPVIEVIGIVADAILSVLVPILGTLLIGIINNVVGVFEGFSNIVMGVVGIVTSIFTGFRDTFVAIFNNDIGGALSALGTMFKGIWDGIWQVVGGALELLWNGVQLLFIGKLIGGIKTGLTSIGAFFKSSWDDIVKLVTKLWDDIIKFFTKGFDNAKTSTTNGLKAIADFFKTQWEKVSKTVSEAFTNVVKFVDDGITKAKDAVSKGLQAILDFFKQRGTNLVDNWKGTFDKVVKFVDDGIAKAKDAVSRGLQAILDFFQQRGTNLVNNWKATFDKVASFVNDGIAKAKSFVSSGLDSMVNFFRNGFSNMLTATINGFNNVMNWIRAIPGNITSTLGDLGNLLKGAGNAIIDGFLAGLKATWTKVTDFVGGLGDWIKNNKGPLPYDRALLIPAGNAIMEGLGQGLRDKIGMLKSTLETVTGTMTDSVTNAFAKNKMYLAGADAALGLADGLKSNKRVLANALSAVMPAASTSVSASLVGTTARTSAAGVEGSTPSRGGIVLEAGAIVVSTPTQNPEIVASKVIDEFANYSNL